MGAVLWELAMNIGMLSLFASLITKMRTVQSLLIERREGLFRKTLLAFILGLVCVFSTSTGIHLDNVIVNTRVIGALAAGIIGGPYVGSLAGLIGGGHRYFYDLQGFTTVACSLSTLLAGVIGGFVSPYFLRGRWTLSSIAFFTALIELLHMGLILLLCRPWPIALETVRTIALPMVMVNSVGMVIFISTIKDVYKRKDMESEGKLRLALSVAERSLPYFRRGVSDLHDMSEAASVLLSATPLFRGILIADRQRILAARQSDSRLDFGLSGAYLEIARRTLDIQETLTISPGDAPGELRPLLKNYNIITAPLLQMNQPAGCLIVFVRRKWLHQETDIGLVKGLASLLSTQLELSQIDYQKRLRHKAELNALQSQVNPHFLYNALNTLACICREDPGRARDLLQTMAVYYRQALESDRPMISLSEEVDQLKNYLVLEQARFEEKLSVRIEIPPDEAMMVPPLILQPLVENAVKYGADAQGTRRIRICLQKASDFTRILVKDSGPGFPQTVLDGLALRGDVAADPSLGRRHRGLMNVKKRLKSVYGEDSELEIQSFATGSIVSLKIPHDRTDPEKGECVS